MDLIELGWYLLTEASYVSSSLQGRFTLLYIHFVVAMYG